MTDRPRWRVADTIAATLHAHGARHGFGIPGGEVVDLLDGLEAAGIAFTLARQESAAAAMAGGAWLAGGGLPVLITTIGPGLASAVNGIADASQEHVPLIVLSGVVDPAVRSRFTHQVIDHRAMLAPFVKASFELTADGAAATVARAVALATTEPMGPVHLDISPTVAAADTARQMIAGPPAILRPQPTADDPAIRRIADRLATAERPLILAGFDAARDPAAGSLIALATALGAPVLTTYKGKGVIPEDHPLSLGAAGLSPAADALLAPVLRAADLILLVGYDPIEMRIGWLDALDPPERLVEIGPARHDHAMHAAGLTLVAPIGTTLAALAAAIGPSAATWTGGAPATARAALTDRFAGPDRFGPHAVIAALQRHAGPDAIVTVDSGAHRILLSQRWTARRPLRLLQSAGFCTMATALPMAIGAKIADPTAAVFAVMGDGGLEMCLGELATLRDSGLPVTVVVFQDESLALIALKQAASGLAPLGVDLGATDFAAIARAFGGTGATVSTTADLDRELALSATRDGFSLIACRFSADEYHQAF